MRSFLLATLLASAAFAADVMITTFSDSLCTGQVLGNTTANFGQTVEMNGIAFIAIRVDQPPMPVVKTRCPIINSYSTADCSESQYELGISLTSMCDTCDTQYGFTTTCDSSDNTVVLNTDCGMDPNGTDSCYQCDTQYPLQSNTCTNTSAALQFVSFQGIVPCIALNYTYWFAPDPNVPCMDGIEGDASPKAAALRAQGRGGKSACPVAATIPAGLCSAGVLVTLLNIH
eukprot:GILI01018128.1.p1 GENE.GILI01018128.1~~GILI01018128.1.p1  ORF type:complete len:230 (+),score=44.43 GILI01018128.1:81-770(+)